MRTRLALFTVLVFVAATSSASAQSIQWGMWGEPPERNRAAPSKSAAGDAEKKAAAAAKAAKPIDLAESGPRPEIKPRMPKVVAFPNALASGSIVVDTAARKLYFTLSPTHAYLYPVAVGKDGFTWTGVEKVSRVEAWPDWIPPDEMRLRRPGLPLRMTGGINNPLGARAIYLGDTLYRIHGTNDSSSIGSAASSGCFRMHNADVAHLAALVTKSTTVYVMPKVPRGITVMPIEPAVKPAIQKADQQQAPAGQAAPVQASKVAGPAPDGAARPAPAQAQPPAAATADPRKI